MSTLDIDSVQLHYAVAIFKAIEADRGDVIEYLLNLGGDNPVDMQKGKLLDSK